MRVHAQGALLAEVVAAALSDLTALTVAADLSGPPSADEVHVTVDDVGARWTGGGRTHRAGSLALLARALAGPEGASLPAQPDGGGDVVSVLPGPGGEPLTTREPQVLLAMRCGADNATIAGELGISVHTVRAHVGSVLRKTGSSSRIDVIARAR